jgi:hypothetical protein
LTVAVDYLSEIKFHLILVSFGQRKNVGSEVGDVVCCRLLLTYSAIGNPVERIAVVRSVAQTGMFEGYLPY